MLIDDYSKTWKEENVLILESVGNSFRLEWTDSHVEISSETTQDFFAQSIKVPMTGIYKELLWEEQADIALSGLRAMEVAIFT